MEIDSLAVRIEYMDRGIFHDTAVYQMLIDNAKKITPYWELTASKYEATFLQFYSSSAICPWMIDQFRKYIDKPVIDPDHKFGFIDPDTLFSSLGLTEDCYNSQLYLKQIEGLLDMKLIKIKAFLVKPLAKSKDEILFNIKEAELIEIAASLNEIKSWL